MADLPEGGYWRTTDDGRHIYIHGGLIVAGLGKQARKGPLVGKDGSITTSAGVKINRSTVELVQQSVAFDNREATWKPSMTSAEADAWAKDSAWKDPVYHFTRSKANVEGIQKDGFNTPESGGQSYWGQGAYFYPKDAKQGGKNWGDHEVQAKVNVRNVLTIPDKGSEKWLDSTIAVAKAKYPGEIQRVAVRKYLESKGHDALFIEGTSGWMGGGRQLVVFNKKHVTVVK